MVSGHLLQCRHHPSAYPFIETGTVVPFCWTRRTVENVTVAAVALSDLNQVDAPNSSVSECVVCQFSKILMCHGMSV